MYDQMPSTNKYISRFPISKFNGRRIAVLYPDNIVFPSSMDGALMSIYTPLFPIFVDRPPAIIFPNSPLKDFNISPSSFTPNIFSPICPKISVAPAKISFPFVSPVIAMSTAYFYDKWSCSSFGLEIIYCNGITFFMEAIALFSSNVIFWLIALVVCMPSSPPANSFKT